MNEWLRKIQRVTFFWIRKISKIKTNFSEFLILWKKTIMKECNSLILLLKVTYKKINYEV